jgi:hypothetical protein
MNEKWFEKIDRYLNLEMTHEEQLLFESEIADDEELSSAFRVYRRIEEEMKSKGDYRENEASLKESLKRLNEKYFKVDNQLSTKRRISENDPEILKRSEGSSKSTDNRLTENNGNIKRMYSWKNIAIAAAIISFISLGALWYLQSEKQTKDNRQTVTRNDNIAKTSDAPKEETVKQNGIRREGSIENTIVNPPSLETNRKKYIAVASRHFKPDVSPSEVPDPSAVAMELYEAKNYENAISAFNESARLMTRGDEDIELIEFYSSYYKGISYLAIGNDKKALTELQNSVKKSPNENWRIRSQWYLALASLKNGNLQAADKLFHSLADNTHAGKYKSESTGLINELK